MIDKEKLRARILAEPDVACEIGAPMSDSPRTDAKERESEGLCTSFEGAKTHAHYGWKFARTLERELSQALSRVRELEADARRYRWLRDTTGWHEGRLHKIITLHANALWDQAIDDAILAGDSANE